MPQPFSSPQPLPDPLLQQLDRVVHAAQARLSSSLSPISIVLAWTDWASHLLASPGKQLSLVQSAGQETAALGRYAIGCAATSAEGQACLIEAPETDRRFADPAWRQWPFNLLHQSFLLTERWWSQATHGVWGVEKHHEDVVAFAARQWLDVFSPGNLPATNPVVLKKTAEQGGLNLLRGLANASDEARRLLAGQPSSVAGPFKLGKQIAVTPGKVVFRNRLIELIQYTPSTATVHAEPILVVPAWIMKYYILDLSPSNSLIKYLVDQGHTVFCISWKNPGPQERNLGMDDYLALGLEAALDVVNDIVPKRRVHAVGYCLGGTLLAIGAAAMRRDGDDRLASLTLFAAQTDFSEPGELGLFVDESQVSLLEAQMAEKGYLTAGQMAGAFEMLRSYDLIWSRMVSEYLLGEHPVLNDLMTWNSDTTRMPARMHVEYLRRLFLRNELSEGHFPAHGKVVALSDIDLPIFMVGTETDHVAPWRSVHKLHYLCPAQITYVLTSGGHNAGIVSEPGHPRRHYRLLKREAGGRYIAPDAWLAAAPLHEGSWWPAWLGWLVDRTSPKEMPPHMGSRKYPPQQDAPGSYVLER